MSVTDEILVANEIYSRNHHLVHLSPRPKRKLAILTCMDTRLSIRTLGLDTGDAHIIRNAGGIVTEDALRSLIISHYQLGSEEFVLIHHTDCGMQTFTDDELRARLQRISGTAVLSPHHFYAFQDVERSVREQMQKLQSHPWIPKEIKVRGFVYDVKTGRLKEILG
ncbi:MAG: carbonic anhydrase [Acidobacteriaceae bacterium]|nr:carbonic anhydrase [Acidobacteriaceae bacterium]